MGEHDDYAETAALLQSLPKMAAYAVRLGNVSDDERQTLLGALDAVPRADYDAAWSQLDDLAEDCRRQCDRAERAERERDEERAGRQRAQADRDHFHARTVEAEATRDRLLKWGGGQDTAIWKALEDVGLLDPEEDDGAEAVVRRIRAALSADADADAEPCRPVGHESRLTACYGKGRCRDCGGCWNCCGTWSGCPYCGGEPVEPSRAEGDPKRGHDSDTSRPSADVRPPHDSGATGHPRAEGDDGECRDHRHSPTHGAVVCDKCGRYIPEGDDGRSRAYAAAREGIKREGHTCGSTGPWRCPVCAALARLDREDADG